MIEAAQFIEAARERGFSRYAGVPCSFLTPFINYVIQDPALDYVSAANEGDAVALTAGRTLGGQRGVTMMQNSGLGNAVSPLTSLTWTFRLPQLLIVTWRGEPGVADEPQHALMGPITPRVLETMDIPWEVFPQTPEAIEPALARACDYMDRTGRPYALLMKKGSVASFPLKGSGAPEPRAARAVAPAAAPSEAPQLSRTQALTLAMRHSAPAHTVVLGSTGFTGREMYALDDRPNQLYMVGSMGCIGMLGLGLALERPDWRVLAIDGDGSALMRMSVFATIGAYGPPNLSHLVLDNGTHDSTGGQATVSGNVSFAGVAAACGYARVAEGAAPAVLDTLFDGSVDKDVDADVGSGAGSGIDSDIDLRVDMRSSAPRAAALAGSRFARLVIRAGSPGDLPRPDVTPVEVRRRLMAHIGAAPLPDLESA